MAGGAVRLVSGLGHLLTAILRDIVRLILPAFPEIDCPARKTVEHDVTRYLAVQIQAMPGYLRLPYKLALLGFGLLPFVRYGRCFRGLPASKQASYLALWNDAPVLPMRDFVKLIRSSALLVYFDHFLVIEGLEAQRRRLQVREEPQSAAND